jgi:hypothetical protein
MPRPPDDCPHNKVTEGNLENGVASARCDECGVLVYEIEDHGPRRGRVDPDEE